MGGFIFWWLCCGGRTGWASAAARFLRCRLHARVGQPPCAAVVSALAARWPTRTFLLRQTRAGSVAPPLTVVMSTSASPGVAVPVRDARAAWVVSTATVAHETTADLGPSNNAR